MPRSDFIALYIFLGPTLSNALPSQALAIGSEVGNLTMHSPHLQLHCGLEKANDLEKTLAAEIMVIGYCDKTTDGKECNLQCCLDLILV